MMLGTTGKGYRPFSSATHNIVTDGNSIAYYTGATVDNQGLATTIQGLPVLAGSGIVVGGFATGGHSFDNMIAGIGSVRATYDAAKTNILYFDEFTNQAYSTLTASEVIDKMLNYISQLTAGGQNWNIRCFTTIPRGVGDSRNYKLEEIDNLIRANWRAYGLGGYIDRRLPGSPWRMTGYTQADFNAIAQYYTADERQGSGVPVLDNLHTHPSDLGYALQRSMLDMDLRRIGYWR